MTTVLPAALEFVSEDHEGSRPPTYAAIAAQRSDGQWVVPTPGMLVGLEKARRVWAEFGKSVLQITFCVNGEHSWASLHYAGQGADGRRWMFTSLEAVLVRDRLREVLGPDYDIVLEDSHFHFEYQPKGAPKTDLNVETRSRLA